jgi:hypothetical protein
LGDMIFRNPATEEVMSLGKSEPPTCRRFFLEGCEDASCTIFSSILGTMRPTPAIST